MNRSNGERVRVWRRRVLQRRGARLRSAMARGSDSASVAMLDETGVVVSWYGHAGATSDRVVDRHVSQFYIPEEIASNQPVKDLRSAAVGRSSIKQGWRRDTEGKTYWASVVIEAVVLRDGRLQGFSYVSRECTSPPMGVSLSPSQDSAMARPRGALHLTPLLLVLAVCASLAVAAEPGELPVHARADRYGSGWECMSGFRRAGDTCVRVIVPANGYLDASGSGWRCNRGYLNVDDRCVAIQVPEHGYLDSDAYSKGWRCDRDYREIKGTCVPIVIPADAHATGSSYGAGWECNRGFRLAGGACLPVPVPAQGFLSRSGDSWECERGFRKDEAACVAVQPPANAHLDYSGNDWTCDDGFHTHGALCVAD